MRHLGILLLAACPAALLAQTPDADQRVLQTLLSEVQQLRIAIERQTLLGTRTQIAISQLQLQESRVAAVRGIAYPSADTPRSALRGVD
jgi:hypothetical protein